MSGEPAPAPESCRHNLHRVGEGRTPRPEPTDLCRNALGVFHMADCPLAVGLGLTCSYYEASPQPHETTGDLDLEAAHEELQRDFLGWRYRRRVRWLTKPRNLVPVPLVVDAAPEPEEVVPETLAMRQPPDAAVPVPPPPAAGAESTTDVVAVPVPAAPERYPGQRRSEERLAKKKARLARRAAEAAAAKAAQFAAVAGSAAPEAQGGDEEEGDEEFGEDLVEDVEPVDTGPKTVEQVLAALPDAPIGPPPSRRGDGGRGGPPRDGRPRHRRRRGRRGRGGGGGGGGPRPGGGPAPGPGPRG